MITYPTGDGDTVEVYEGADGWRWRVRAGNGRLIATSGEAFARRGNAARAARRVHPVAPPPGRATGGPVPPVRAGDPYAPPKEAA